MAAAFRRVVPALHLGSSVEVALLAQAQVSLPHIRKARVLALLCQQWHWVS